MAATAKRAKRKTAHKPADAERGVYALIPTKDMVPLPGVVLPIYVSSGGTADALNYALKNNHPVVLCLDKSKTDSLPKINELAAVGTIARISQAVKLSNGDLKVRLAVQFRVTINKISSRKTFVEAAVTRIPVRDRLHLTASDEQFIKDIKERFSVLQQYDPSIEDHVLGATDLYDPGELADNIAAAVPLTPVEAQRLLEEQDGMKRLRLIADTLTAYVDSISIRERVSAVAERELGRAQHQELLREQIRQIQAELGEEASYEDELRDITKQLKKLRMPPEVRKEAEHQIRRLQQLHPDTSEAALARTYLDWIMDLPWSKRSKDELDLRTAKSILDADHYGLEKPKERILDFLGVGKLRKAIKGPILLFLGPPGVGKTSLGRSIAKALGRQFVRASVGGLRDEAELRGHRRTYVGALPGRILQGLKTAATKNPVFMLDEIDKIGSDFRGDPASVLLEILDPEQNRAFEDHYLNLPFDLSEVMFIATANMTDTIPAALMDRMEIIELAGYTTEEKLQIAKRYLVPRAKEENGVADTAITVPDRSLEFIINCYTRESGVRELGRIISTVYRKVARLIAEGEKPPTNIVETQIEEFLGPVKFLPDKQLQKDEVGIVTGLAWTPVGGEVLTIEASMTPGRGTLSLTGQMGDVMRESAMAALTYVQSNAARLGIDPNFYETANVHIHVPQGAIPKDGPSAGMAIGVALVSLLTGRPVSRNISMTGELTLRGNVLAIGGLKEKSLAALRLGTKTVIIPKENERELVEFPDYLRKQVHFVPVDHIDGALETALVGEAKALPKKSAAKPRAAKKPRRAAARR